MVSFDEGVAIIDDYIHDQGYTDLIAVQPVGAMLADLEVTRQAEMMAINGDGIIYHRQVIGKTEDWLIHLDALSADPSAIPSSLEAERQNQQRQQDIQLPS